MLKRLLDSLREFCGLCVHEWPQWSPPFHVFDRDGAERYNQRQDRRCTLCGSVQQRACGKCVIADEEKEFS